VCGSTSTKASPKHYPSHAERSRGVVSSHATNSAPSQEVAASSGHSLDETACVPNKEVDKHALYADSRFVRSGSVMTVFAHPSTVPSHVEAPAPARPALHDTAVAFDETSKSLRSFLQQIAGPAETQRGTSAVAGKHEAVSSAHVADGASAAAVTDASKRLHEKDDVNDDQVATPSVPSPFLPFERILKVLQPVSSQQGGLDLSVLQTGGGRAQLTNDASATGTDLSKLHPLSTEDQRLFASVTRRFGCVLVPE